MSELSLTTKEEKIKFLKKEKASVFYKDFSVYSDSQIDAVVYGILLSKKLNLKSILTQWLTKKIVEKNLKGYVIKEDYAPLLVSFQLNEDAANYNNIFSFENVADLINYLESNYGSEKKMVPMNEMNIFFELNGRFIAMPMTTRASIFLGKDTVWCTAYTASENMFESYTSDKAILFYIIKTNANPRKNPEDKICVGYSERKIQYDSSMTVDSSNKTINEERLYKILGKDTEKFKQAMGNMVSKYKGIHPIERKADEVAKKKDKFEREVKANGLIKTVNLISNRNMSLEVFQSFYEIVNDNDSEYLKAVRNEISLGNVFRKLGDYIINTFYVGRSHRTSNMEIIVRKALIGSELSEETQEKTIKYIESNIRNFTSPINIDEYIKELYDFSYNKSLTEKTRLELIKNRKFFSFFGRIIEKILLNDNCQSTVIDYIYKCISSGEYKHYGKNDIIAIASHQNTSKKVINDMLSSGNSLILEGVASSSLVRNENIANRLMKYGDAIANTLSKNQGLNIKLKIEFINNGTDEMKGNIAKRLSRPELDFFISSYKYLNDNVVSSALFSNENFKIEKLKELMKNRKYLLQIAQFFPFSLILVEKDDSVEEYNSEFTETHKPYILDYLDESVIDRLVINKNMIFATTLRLINTTGNKDYFWNVIDSLEKNELTNQPDYVIEGFLEFFTEDQFVHYMKSSFRGIFKGTSGRHTLVRQFESLKEEIQQKIPDAFERTLNELPKHYRQFFR